MKTATHRRSFIVSVGCQLKGENIRLFEEETGVTVSLEPAQEEQIQSGQPITLGLGQLDALLERLCPTPPDLLAWASTQQSLSEHISMTLYVLNTDTWNLMLRRPSNQDMMLPMATIPWFYCQQDAKSKRNPMGVRRCSTSSTVFAIERGNSMLTVTGHGGDFCGFVEARTANEELGGRAIILPKRIGPRDRIPLYRHGALRVSIRTEGLETTLYPPVEESFDYNFSESPSVFRSHGLRFRTSGETVTLQTGRSPGAALKGEIVILVGKRFLEPQDDPTLLLFHLWLNALKKLLNSMA